jgi:hypothetical protein
MEPAPKMEEARRQELLKTTQEKIRELEEKERVGPSWTARDKRALKHYTETLTWLTGMAPK